MFLFLEMLKVFFPGGDPLVAPTPLVEIENEFGMVLGGGRQSEANDVDSARFLSRVFSMFSLEDAGVATSHRRAKIDVSNFDFDIAQFCTLMERFKYTWRSTFQAILFRAVVSGRANIMQCLGLSKKMAFAKKGSSGLCGLIIKSFLARDALTKDPTNPNPIFQQKSFREEFSFLTEEEILKVLEYGAELWMIIRKMHKTAVNRSQSLTDNADDDSHLHLKTQFDEAHAFLLFKLTEHNTGGEYDRVLTILGADGGAQPGRYSVAKGKTTIIKAADGHGSLAAPADGLSSQ